MVNNILDTQEPLIAILILGCFALGFLRALSYQVSESIRMQYGHMLGMFCVAAFLFYLFAQQIIWYPRIDHIKSSMEKQCLHNPVACMMRARIAVADGEWPAVKRYAQKAKALGYSGDEYARMVVLYQVSYADPDQAWQWVNQHPSDTEVIASFAQRMHQEKRFHDAYKLYELLQEQCYDDVEKEKITKMLAMIKKELKE